MNNKIKNIVAVASVVGVTTLAHAQSTGPDLTAVTDGVSALKTAVLTAAGVVVAAGLTLMSMKFGGKWVVRVFKTFTS